MSLSKKFLRPFSTNLSPRLGEKIIKFWNDETVLEVFSRRNEFQILDNTGYYCEHIHRITEEGYIPTDLDILQTRIKTTGIIETSYIEKGKNFIIIDVGGQRSERKKWIHVFENVTGVIFCVGLSSFDQTIPEDNTTNRMIESLNLFTEINASPWFQSVVMILLLNKADLFREKLEAGKSISNIFPEFTGGLDYDGSINFIKGEFLKVLYPDKSIMETGKKRAYCHVTNATDTENIRFVFLATRDFIMKDNLKKSGFY
jgi:GTPase SAR1 family protein